MSDFTQLLKHNRNYRFTWVGQIVSEAGDHFNNVAVLDLTLRYTHSGFAVAGIMLSQPPRRFLRVPSLACSLIGMTGAAS